MLSKVASSTIFWVFGMTRPGIEPLSPRSLGKVKRKKDMFDFSLFSNAFRLQGFVWKQKYLRKLFLYEK